MNRNTFNFLGQHFALFPEKAMLWLEKECLLISDLHFGKITHFRKAGIAVPRQARLKNWSKLNQLIERCNPRKLLILGDLFHSVLNTEWDEMRSLFDTYGEIEYHLVLGNHDILQKSWYLQNNFIVHDQQLVEDPFIFSHEPLEIIPPHLYNICGHIHPSIVLKGKARQRLRLPCFYFGEKMGILPAFGEFTGTSSIKFSKSDHVFVIADDRLIKIE